MIVSLLYKNEIEVTPKISIRIPTVGEILDNQDEYFNLIYMITATPTDYMVQLDDLDINFAEISEYDLFLLLFRGMQSMNTELIFGDMDLSKFAPAVNEQNGNIVLLDKDHDIVIDALIHELIANQLRKLHNLSKNTKIPGNEAARSYMIERARAKMRRNKNKKEDSYLESLIVALVNTEQFKYDFDSVRNLTIYQFNESVQQVVKKISYDNLMRGVYAGTIDAKGLSSDQLNWLSHKKK